MSLIHYGKWIEAIMVDRGVMLPDAQRIAHAAAPGARRAWESASESERAAAIIPDVPKEGTEKSGRAAAAEPELPYQPIDREGIRRAINRGKPKSEVAATDTITSTSNGDQDYFGLIAAERQRSGCDFATAAARVNRSHPHAWRSMLEKANPGRNLDHKFQK